MERRQIILIAIIVVFGFGSYLALMLGSANFENSFCGEYRAQQQSNYYRECLGEMKTALVCEEEAAERAWAEVQGLPETECQTRLEEGNGK